MNYLELADIGAVARCSGPRAQIFFVYDKETGWQQDEWGIICRYAGYGEKKKEVRGISEDEMKKRIEADDYSFRLQAYLADNGIPKESSTEKTVEDLYARSDKALPKASLRKALNSGAASKWGPYFFEAPSQTARSYIALNIFSLLDDKNRGGQYRDAVTAVRRMLEKELSERDLAYIQSAAKKRGGEENSGAPAAEKGRSEEAGRALQTGKKGKTADTPEEQFLKLVEKAGGEAAAKTAAILIKAVQDTGLSAAYPDGTSFTSEVLDIIPEETEGGHVRIVQRISKLVVENSLTRKQVTKLFKQFGDSHSLWKGGKLKIQGNSYLLDISALGEKKVLDDYLKLLHTLAQKRMEEKERERERQKQKERRKKEGARRAAGSGKEVQKAKSPNRIEAESIAHYPDSLKMEDPGNDALEAAIHRYCEEGGEKPFIRVILELHKILLEDGNVIIPMRGVRDLNSEELSATVVLSGKDQEHIYLMVLTSLAAERDYAEYNAEKIFCVLSLREALSGIVHSGIPHVGISLNPASRDQMQIDEEDVQALLESVEEEEIVQDD